ncbi:hypothetical protein [Aquimarina sp. I32.4]|uniref:hypothetical protein n=1 Tax=Aquimarina sp. I32.4 TaxID=2053903 RepID=UPI0011AF1984|nr:hypothetical protein [Aquimarina sp. I32.4]
MKFINFFSCFFLMLAITPTRAQGYKTQDNPWILGIGANIVYDPGALFSGLFDIKDNYNYHSPVRVSLEKRFNDDYGFEVSGNFNKLLEGKVINGGRLEDEINFLALDGMFKYYITNTYQNKYRAIYEGYLATGIGGSFYNGSGAKTANLGVGFNIYLSESIRFNAQATGKISIDNSTVGTNYIHYNLGFIIRLEDSHFN